MTLVLLLRADDLATASLWFDFEAGEGGADAPLDALGARLLTNPKLAVCAALPGELAVSRVFSLPMKNEREAQKAAGLLLDDVLARPLDDRVVALGAPGESGRLVSAVEAETIREVLDVLADAGLDPDVLTTDHALLPSPEEESVTALRLGGLVAMRTAEGAFTSEASFAQSLFAGREAEKLREVQAEGLVLEGVPNFRRGMFAKRRPLPDFKPFALAASLALVAGALFLVSSLVQGTRYAGAASSLRQQAEANFTRAFPGTPIIDMERQILAQSGDAQSSDFLPLSAVLAELIAEQDTTTLSSLTYAASGELTAELTVVSIPDLDTIKNALTARGIDVQEGGDVRREDGALVARLFLRGL